LGGSPAANGGSPAANGGSLAANGGTPAANGGTRAANGGAWAASAGSDLATAAAAAGHPAGLAPGIAARYRQRLAAADRGAGRDAPFLVQLMPAALRAFGLFFA